jgi:hypothetical protein
MSTTEMAHKFSFARSVKLCFFCDARCMDDLHTMVKAEGAWVELGGADEQKPAKEGTVEAWGPPPVIPLRVGTV